MVTKFRIAYPYASSDPQRTREAVVILKPSLYPGFSTVYVRGRSCSLVRTDRGPDILRGLETGLQGQLIEPDPDPRRSIVHRGKIIGQGRSMELALVLSAFGSYENDNSFEEAPILILSGSIEQPRGAPPFVDGKIKTYCSKEEAEEALVEKYMAATMASACALVLPKRDAILLSSLLETKLHPLLELESLLSFPSSETLIFGVEENELPRLAEVIGISPYHYQRATAKGLLRPKTYFFISLLLVVFFLWFIFYLLSSPSVFPLGPRSTAVRHRPDLSSPTFVSAPSFKGNYTGFTANLLPTGNVLIRGSVFHGMITRDGEIYMPNFQRFVSAKIELGRVNHTSTLLPNGEILIVGGTITTPNIGTATLEIHPKDILHQVPYLVNSMETNRISHSTTLLASGQVLILGGWSHLKKRIAGEFYDGKFLKTGTIYNPKTKNLQPTSKMKWASYQQGTLLLNNGKVLIVGGWNGAKKIYSTLKHAQLYSPNQDHFELVSPMKERRTGGTLTMLASGKVLICGGIEERKNCALQTAEMYDSRGGTFLYTGSMHFCRWGHTATLLPNGKILVLGGNRNPKKDKITNTAEIYDPQTGEFTLLKKVMRARRWSHRAILMPSGEVLILGGVGPKQKLLKSCEIYRGTYLLKKGEKPFLSFVDNQPLSPISLSFGKNIVIRGENLKGKTSVVLVQFGGSGHNNSPSRYFRLRPERLKDEILTVTLPQKNKNPAGYYLLFVLRDGLLSNGLIVKMR